MLFTLHLIILASLVCFSDAVNTFQTECNVPNVTENYIVQSPNTRGTVDILWSSLATIVVCVYTVLHLPVPEQRAPDRKHTTWRQNFFGRTFWYCSLATMSPELLVTIAWGDWWDARKQLKDLHSHMAKTKDHWTVVHMFYANMGGFVLRYGRTDGHESLDDDEVAEETVGLVTSPADDEVEAGSVPAAVVPVPHQRGRSPSPIALNTLPRNKGQLSRIQTPDQSRTDQDEQSRESSLTELRSRESQQSRSSSSSQASTGQNSHNRDSSPTTPSTVHSGQSRSPSPIQHPKFRQADPKNKYFYLNAEVLQIAIREGLLDATLPISEQDIEARAKSEWLGKSLVVLQLVNFFVNFFARLGFGLPVTQLEVAVLAYTTCSLFTWGFLFQKPKDVASVVTLGTYEVLPERLLELKARHVGGKIGLESSPTGTLSKSDYKEALDPPDLINTMHVNIFSMPVLAGFTTLYGAIHLTAWPLYFSSQMTKYLWCGPALILTSFIPIMVIWVVVGECWPVLFDGWNRQAWRQAWKNWHEPENLGTYASKFTGLYVWARLILFGAGVSSLLYLPPDAYLTPNWPINIPSIN